MGFKRADPQSNDDPFAGIEQKVSKKQQKRVAQEDDDVFAGFGGAPSQTAPPKK